MKITSMRAFCFSLIVLVSCCVVGCVESSSSSDEIESKSEYSILQFYEYKFRGVGNAEPYILYRDVRKSGVDVVGFPVKDKVVGYVWLIVEAKNRNSVLVIPESTDFVVTDATLEELKKDVSFSPAVLKFIEDRK